MNAVEILDLKKQYRGNRALGGFDLRVQEGYVHGIVGPNGAGKTTLIKALLGLVKPDGWTVRVFGQDIAGQDQIRDRVGFVHERNYLFDDLTLGDLESILSRAYSQWDHRRFIELLDHLELPAATRVKEFSKGMKTRASLAVALSHNAELIIMDEPSSGMDPMVRRELLDLVSQEMTRGNRSFLIATHITSDLDRVADHIDVIADGRNLLSLSADELETTYALCKGDPKILSEAEEGLFTGPRVGSYNFAALTSRKADVQRTYGNAVVMEKPSIEDVMVHTLQRIPQ